MAQITSRARDNPVKRSVVACINEVKGSGVKKGGDWRTLRSIADCTGDPEASVSAQLRHLRKDRALARTK